MDSNQIEFHRQGAYYNLVFDNENEDRSGDAEFADNGFDIPNDDNDYDNHINGRKNDKLDYESNKIDECDDQLNPFDDLDVEWNE